ncbi:MAG: hypothetical protein CL687_00470 [Candidatus Pelagibacter sp.]|nr:hypothetical protein [Candidatus Pelagibacter sp.]|tara:strand:- start:2283 stop:2993 length:711 start_codon:yes stop_codon:yes gene_type:complete
MFNKIIIKNTLNYYRYRLAKKLKILFTNLMCIYLNLFVIQKKDKNLFIDLGTNLGQGFNLFSKHFKSSKFEYLLVEANPSLKSYLNKLINKIGKDKIQLINKAAFVYNGKTKLYGLVEDHRGKLSDGASIIKEHDSALYVSNEADATEIECFRFVEKLKELKNYDNIIIKMDIEGSEYAVLSDIIDNINEIKNITHIFVEFHAKFVGYKYKSSYFIKEKEVINRLKINKISYTSYV